MQTFIANKDTLLAAIPRLRGRRVLVLGDIMLDIYLEGDAHRISPEAPVPVVNIAGERRMLGGAANVAHNICILGGEAFCLGLCGPGNDGDALCRLLDEAGIQSAIIRADTRKTSVKTRVMARGQQMLRLDKEQAQPLTDIEYTALCDALARVLPACEVVIISDYAKGCITSALCETLSRLCADMPTPPPILVDPKPQNAACYRGVSLLTPNRQEAGQLVGYELHTREHILTAGRAIMQKYGCAQLLITLGGQGMALFMRDGTVWNIPTAAKAVFDVTGAGDTVIATIALALAAGLVLPAACALANYAASGALEQVGVGTLTGEDLLALVRAGMPPEFIVWG